MNYHTYKMSTLLAWIQQGTAALTQAAEAIEARETALAAKERDIDARELMLTTKEAEFQVRERDLATKEAAWMALRDQLDRNITDAPQVISLDVGGMMYKTAKSTLLAVDDSYFHALLGCHDRWTPDSPQNAFFLDLHGHTFDRVLGFLRTGKLSLAGLNEWEQGHVWASMDYLKLALAKPEMWQWDPRHCSSALTISGEKLSLVRSRNDISSRQSAIGDSPRDCFHVQLGGFGLRTFVGLFPRRSPPLEGYFLRLDNGKKATQPMSATYETPYNLAATFTPGDILTVRVIDGKVHFERNGRDLGPAFVVSDPCMPLYPVVSMVNPGNFTIVDGSDTA
ncbi:Aste57867_15071 [Aphanomyces stellatus]|uniref:Aste57867_15071 protein n=1 Tax=Aphanomyces stellatus TaxID=120398 RepID=A0A485L4Z0_9STRA|nr:hypothetical protein As57867_015015 [Aphanomyces stellatus]VFT91884.1 Aste57867_15071 [Aphanomyces stellatus]